MATRAIWMLTAFVIIVPACATGEADPGRTAGSGGTSGAGAGGASATGGLATGGGAPATGGTAGAAVAAGSSGGGAAGHQEATGGTIGTGGSSTGGMGAATGGTTAAAGSSVGGAGGTGGTSPGTGGSQPCGGANLQADSANCGTCGHACAAGQQCLSGMCYGYGACAGRTDLECFVFLSPPNAPGAFPCNPDEICTIQPNGDGQLNDGHTTICSCSFRNGSDDVNCVAGSTCSGT